MERLFQSFENVEAFLELGGTVLLAIAGATFLMWVLIFERLIYLRWIYPSASREIFDRWQRRSDRTSWCARKVRALEVSQISHSLTRSLTTIKTLIALCPLLGLLGTVTGMIEVFDIMAMVGSGNTRAMASGVSLATIPTMAGMVAALSGLYFCARLERSAEAKKIAVIEVLGREAGNPCAAE